MIDIQNLIIEVTRKCNMACEHCLRGNAQNKIMKHEYIDSFLSQCKYVSSVTFSGGEPNLHPEIIEYFLEQCKLKNISIGFFYIATNGLNISLEFIIVCLKLYSYCSEKEYCSIQVSNDIFHANENKYNTELLDGLSFFSRKNTEERYNYGGYRFLISEGRAKENFNPERKNSVQKIKTIEDFNDSQIYLNCNGQIINGCDWSYTSQNKHILCSVENLQTYFNTLQNENN